MSAPHEHPVPESPHDDDDNQSPGDRNDCGIRCSKCNCLLLRQGHGSKVQLKVELPKTDSSRDSDPPEVETETQFLLVDDIFTFENMGFSHTVASRKYLACAECEFGPIGYHDLSSGKSYLSLVRVCAESSDT